MQQFEKGYSVLENIPEENVNEPRTGQSKFGKHAILWHWFIFAVIATLIFSWAYFLAQLQYAWESDMNCGSFENSNDEKHHSFVLKSVGNPSDILEVLNENDKIEGQVWNAWTNVVGTDARHVCKIDDGVGNSGADFVIKRYELYRIWQKDPPIITVVQKYTVPSGYNFTGLVAIDDWRDGTGADCRVHRNKSEVSVTLMSQEYRGLHFVVLVIGKVNTGQVQNRAQRRTDEFKSDEEFKDYVY